MKHILSFAIAFILAAVVALAARTALHQSKPNSNQPAHTGHNHAPNSTAPSAAPAAIPATAQKTINTVCPICGMDVNPSLTAANYKGQLVGFGCRACPPKFAKEPDRYGPAALKNKVVEE